MPRVVRRAPQLAGNRLLPTKMQFVPPERDGDIWMNAQQVGCDCGG